MGKAQAPIYYKLTTKDAFNLDDYADYLAHELLKMDLSKVELAEDENKNQDELCG